MLEKEGDTMETNNGELILLLNIQGKKKEENKDCELRDIEKNRE